VVFPLAADRTPCLSPIRSLSRRAGIERIDTRERFFLCGRVSMQV
jgi:hypothetical protein